MRVFWLSSMLWLVAAPGAAQDAGAEADAGADADADVGAEAEARARSHDEELFRVEEGSPETAVAGVLTLVGVASAIAGAAWLIERISAADQCDQLESRDPRTMGCVNVEEIRGQRDGGIGLLIAGASLAVGAGIAWAVLEATDEEPSEAAVVCVGIACVGRF